jgi:ATP-dependent DNA helicase RecG
VAGQTAANPRNDNAELVDTLRKILEHERRLGFADRAVQGGLEQFVDRWLTRWPSHERGAAEQLARPLTNYRAMDQARRQRAIAAALDLAQLPLARQADQPPLLLGEDSDHLLRLGAERTVRVALPPSGELIRPPRPPDVAAEPPDTARPDALADPRPRARAPALRAPKVSPVRDAATSIGETVEAGLINLKGVGPANAERFRKLGVETIRDLLYHFPRRHLDYRSARLIRDLSFEEYETILVTIWGVKVENRPGGLVVIRAILADESGTSEAVWFRRKDYLSRDLIAGQTIVVSGECRLVGGRPVFKDPDWEVFSGEDTVHTNRLVPVYPLVEGLNGRLVRRVAKQAVDRYAGQLIDYLPVALRDDNNLIELSAAIANAHFPDSDESLRAARRRLAFDELLVVQLGLLARRRNAELGERAPELAGGESEVQAFLAVLPFRLTDAQARALAQVRSGLSSSRPMGLLLEGDVGSGKTVVAAAGAVQVVSNGFQAAIMAPTEILAEQHYRTLGNLFGLLGPAGPRLTLLTGSIKGSERRQRYAEIASGEADVVVGTQALVQEGLAFARLGLVVVDEQHRFGVAQRSTLRQKGYNPHVLVMTATPIPRTLALTLYGDLDLAIIDELPPGRQTIKTRHLPPSERPRAYEFLRREVAAGHQAFIICPLVEESDKSDARAATAEYERLQREVFPDLRLGLLHGRLKAADKEAVMRQFQRGDLDAIVSTAVVEVGIDVPNATVMLIEGANRFGLAQLHQFRGRVGRGSAQSYCLLISDTPSEAADKRLAALESINDGFALAMEDLKMRGPGEFFGTRQSGLPDLKMAQLSDVVVIEQARSAAIKLYEVDPQLAEPAHRALRQMVTRFWQGQLDLN